MDATGNKFQHQSSTPKTVELQFLRAITKQFSEDQILGNGGFGTVYKGEKEDGEVVAVKKLKLINMVGMDDKQFLSEVKHLVDVCHPNIVRLEGYCYHIERVLTPYNGSLIWVDEVYRLLCFEYLPNGSLDKHLTDESSGLDWDKRYHIIEGICKGLHYLHEGRRGASILHLDLKPSNILLDKNMVPKIADFGLSRLFGEEKTHTCTMNLRGSFGYMPPEYIEKRMISKESDIFSLGVIIIEIVTGHRKYPDSTTTQEFIKVPEKWRRRLQTTSNYTSLEEDCRQVNQCIKVGLKCMEREPKKRPNIREIIEMLNGCESTNSCSVGEDGLEPSHEHSSANGSNTNIRLRFLNYPKTPIYTDRNITAENNAAIKIGMFAGHEMITSGPLSMVKVEILVLRRDFCNDVQDNWTEEDFNKYIVQSRNGQGFVLGGDCTVWLNNGQAAISQIHFKEGSSRTRSRKFIMGARVCNSEKTGVRVQEAIMKPVTVLDRRNEANEKRHPPMLDDDVYRLEEIAKDGVYHKRLQKAHIITVQDFLKALNKDENKLREILQMKKQHNSWEKMVRHARECFLEDRHELKPYQNEEGNVVLFFNCVHDLVGGEFRGNYITYGEFDPAQKAVANKLKEGAYDKLEDTSFDYVMKGKFPEPISSSKNTAAGPSIVVPGTSQPNPAGHLAANQGTAAAENSPRGGINQVNEPFYPTANYDPSTPFPDYLSTHDYQDQGTLPIGQQQISTSPGWQQNLGPMNSNDDLECYLPDIYFEDDLFHGAGAEANFEDPSVVTEQSQSQVEEYQAAQEFFVQEYHEDFAD